MGLDPTARKDEDIQSLGEFGSVVLEQLWTLSGTTGIVRKGDNCVSILCGRAVFLPPREWTSVMLPYKMIVNGHISVFGALHKKGLLSGLAVTKGGQIKVQVWNTTSEVIYLTPKTVLVNVVGTKIEIKRMGESKTREVNIIEEDVDIGKEIEKMIRKK